MQKITMKRKASDNKYLHRDFHVSADIGIAYVGNNFGDEAVIEYLSRFAVAYYKPLIENIKEQGLVAIKNWIEKTYEKEEASDAVKISLDNDKIVVEVLYCPAIKAMKEQGHIPSKWYKYTTSTVNQVIAENSGLVFLMDGYNELTGKTKYSFIKK